MAKRVIAHEPASPGIAIGRAYLLSHAAMSIPKFWITDKEVANELLRFRRALQRSKRQLTAIKERLCRFQGREQIQILESHLLLMQDEMLVTRAIQHIANQKINAEWALDKTLEHLKLAFLEARQAYLQERRSDVDYIGGRVMKNLLGGTDPDLRNLPHPETVLIAHDLSPAEVAALPRQRIRGFVTALGGNTSHTAIIARSLEIPAMVGIENILEMVRDGDTLILDGVDGQLLLRPTPREIAAYRAKQRRHEVDRRAALRESRLPAVTRDGHRIELDANIELAEEAASALEHGAEGIGMFRTEFLYLNRSDLPTEEEHFQQYRRVLEMMAPRPVTIRTLDIGGDKIFAHGEYQEHTNPALGLRAIRFCFREREMFHAQLRALYRASTHGTLRILFPMISTTEEARQIQALVREIQGELRRKRVAVAPEVPLGAMIEVPSAAFLAGHLADYFQFFSIGTNDLTQYTLAVDRTNEHVAYLFHALHPAVLQLIAQTVRAAQQRRIAVTVCGEMAGEPIGLFPLLGLEVDCLSMNPISIPRVKRMIREIRQSEAKALAQRLLAADSAATVETLVREAMEQFSSGGA